MLLLPLEIGVFCFGNMGHESGPKREQRKGGLNRFSCPPFTIFFILRWCFWALNCIKNANFFPGAAPPKPHQGLSPWTPLGAAPPCRSSLCAAHLGRMASLRFRLALLTRGPRHNFYRGPQIDSTALAQARPTTLSPEPLTPAPTQNNPSQNDI